MQEEVPIQSPTTPQTTDKDRVIHNLVNEVLELRKQVTTILNDKIVEELKLPENVLNESGILAKPPHRLKTGKGWRPLLESEILEAQSKNTTATDCAKFLGVDYKTYKKWAEKYGLFKINPWCKGSTKNFWAPDKGKYPLNQILEGKFPEYPIHRIKDKLIRSGIKPAVCELCGFEERRVTDKKMPLLLNFLDSNEKNHKLENIQVLCYNCTFLCGKGYIRRGKVEFNFNDPDRIQGATRKVEARF
jgi:hypothetical protein